MGKVAGRLVGGEADCTRCAVRLTACALRRRPTTLLFEKGRAKEEEVEDEVEGGRGGGGRGGYGGREGGVPKGE